MAFLCFLGIILLGLSHSAAAAVEGVGNCPCEDSALCEPVTTQHKKEFLGFVTNEDNWKKYNWTHITTLAMFTELPPELMCYAHQKGVRVVLSGSYPIKELADVQRRRKWTAEQLDKVRQASADGYNLDVEDATRNGTKDTELLTTFVGEFYHQFKSVNKNYQVSFDVAWSPNCTDNRCYDALGLSKVTDFLVVMSYDERSQIYGPCIASANSPDKTTGAGLQSYFDLGIKASQLVMGLPWYGYIYPCVSFSAETNVCTIKPVPFRGAKCSDAAGSEMGYGKLRALQHDTNSTIQWNIPLRSAFFNVKINGTMHQIWLDTPISLAMKVFIASDRDLHGLAIWNFDELDYSGSSEAVKLETADMWSSVDLLFA